MTTHDIQYFDIRSTSTWVKPKPEEVSQQRISHRVRNICRHKGRAQLYQKALLVMIQRRRLGAPVFEGENYL